MAERQTGGDRRCSGVRDGLRRRDLEARCLPAQAAEGRALAAAGTPPRSGAEARADGQQLAQGGLARPTGTGGASSPRQFRPAVGSNSDGPVPTRRARRRQRRPSRHPGSRSPQVRSRRNDPSTGSQATSDSCLPGHRSQQTNCLLSPRRAPADQHHACTDSGIRHRQAAGGAVRACDAREADRCRSTLTGRCGHVRRATLVPLA